MMRTRGVMIRLLLLLDLTACVETSKKDSSQAATLLSAYILDAPPPIAHKLGIAYEGKVRLLGYQIEPQGALQAGKEAELTMYWQADERIEEGWALFTHLLDSKGNRYANGNLDNTGPLRDSTSGKPSLPPSAWQKGKVYVDEQTFPIPEEAKGDEVTVVTGIWKGPNRLKITSGNGDSEQRGIVLRIPISSALPSASASSSTHRLEPPVLRAPKLMGVPPPKIDGKLDDEAWRGAADTGPFVDVTTGTPNATFPVQGKARVTWDDTNLYLGFEVQDENVIGGFPPEAKDPHLWEKECVEIMLDPDGDGDNRDYYEIQISPQNLIFDSQFDDYNQPKGGPQGPFGHQDWSVKAQTAVVVDGSVNKPEDRDHGYTVEAALAWSSFSKAKNSPPKPNDMWRINFYAMKANSGVAWSPILGQGNFHKANRFGRIFFGLPDLATRAPPLGIVKSHSNAKSQLHMIQKNAFA